MALKKASCRHFLMYLLYFVQRRRVPYCGLFICIFIYLPLTETNSPVAGGLHDVVQKMRGEILCSHGGDYEDGCLLGCCAMLSGRSSLTFQRCLLLPLSEWCLLMETDDSHLQNMHDLRKKQKQKRITYFYHNTYKIIWKFLSVY
jgi:hypothetical protein